MRAGKPQSPFIPNPWAVLEPQFPICALESSGPVRPVFCHSHLSCPGGQPGVQEAAGRSRYPLGFKGGWGQGPQLSLTLSIFWVLFWTDHLPCVFLQLKADVVPKTAGETGQRAGWKCIWGSGSSLPSSFSPLTSSPLPLPLLWILELALTPYPLPATPFSPPPSLLDLTWP